MNKISQKGAYELWKNGNVYEIYKKNGPVQTNWKSDSIKDSIRRFLNYIK